MDLPREIVDRYPHKFEILKGDTPPPVNPVDVSDYHVGGGWYDLGDGQKLRRAEAEVRLAAGE